MKELKRPQDTRQTITEENYREIAGPPPKGKESDDDEGPESEDEDETVVSDSGSGTENEDVVQTIITRRTKKVSCNL